MTTESCGGQRPASGFPRRWDDTLGSLPQGKGIGQASVVLTYRFVGSHLRKLHTQANGQGVREQPGLTRTRRWMGSGWLAEEKWTCQAKVDHARGSRCNHLGGRGKILRNTDGTRNIVGRAQGKDAKRQLPV
jgi:hypothetical protein